ncbi:uncharacterized protein LOC143035625 [Oratosquilla oratoria]|uniref:uncharacterized protein LOC143035625 n=1 Tax=Oratosquilla oratoria TaxID=337810 RepID=UPI003F76EE1E
MHRQTIFPLPFKRHSTHRNICIQCLVVALLRTDEDENMPLTSKTTALGDNGITSQVLRLLLEVPGSLLLQLYNLCFSKGYMHHDCTSSTIVPFPKPATDNFRLISLTSCFCETLERICLTRLMFQLQDKLSQQLYGFLPQRSTHHCMMDLYARLSPNSVVAFPGLKSAFDVANREIILNQFIQFGVQTSVGCAVYSPDVEPPEGGWVNCRLPNSSSSTYCELQELLLAVNLLCQQRLNGLVMYDSQSALQTISSPQPIHHTLIHHILQQLVTAQEHSYHKVYEDPPPHTRWNRC